MNTFDDEPGVRRGGGSDAPGAPRDPEPGTRSLHADAWSILSRVRSIADLVLVDLGRATDELAQLAIVIDDFRFRLEVEVVGGPGDRRTTADLIAARHAFVAGLGEVSALLERTLDGPQTPGSPGS